MADSEGTRKAAAATAHEERPERALVIVAHPDEADFGVAGTIARWGRAGTVCRMVCCTSGDAGAAREKDRALREHLARTLRQVRPGAVVAMDPTVIIHEYGFVQHVDHRNAGFAPGAAGSPPRPPPPGLP